eukprot:COSAG02_NODE_1167_length_14137_cov_25.567175_4_plen_148_part_00
MFSSDIDVLCQSISVKISIVAMRVCSVDDADDEKPAEPGEGEIVHVETNEVYKIIYHGGSKKTKVEPLNPGTEYQFFVATLPNEGGLQGAIASCETALEDEEPEEQKLDADNDTEDEEEEEEEEEEEKAGKPDAKGVEEDGGGCVVC